MAIVNRSGYSHTDPRSIGILLVNLGTPTAPTTAAVRKYLAEFLWDPRVVEIPRPIWWLILRAFILPLRPRCSANLYKKIWTDKGAPLQVISQEQAQGLQYYLTLQSSKCLHVVQAMRYGQPSIGQGLNQLRELNAQQILIFPLYPQYAAATTASMFDAVAKTLATWRWIPEIRFINQYADHPKYIQAVADSIKSYWAVHGQSDKLLFSFHGLPKRFVQAGDPYLVYCQQTALSVAKALALPEEHWDIVFQSRFGRAEWLQPYCEEVLRNLPAQGYRNIAIICPGFAADCLETLEEINQQYRETFIRAGGEQFHYIPALNASDVHLQALASIVMQHLQGWI